MRVRWRSAARVVAKFRNVKKFISKVSRLVTLKLLPTHAWHRVLHISWIVRNLCVTDGTTWYDMARHDANYASPLCLDRLHATKIRDSGRPTFWKSLYRHISVKNYPCDMFFFIFFCFHTSYMANKESATRTSEQCSITTTSLSCLVFEIWHRRGTTDRRRQPSTSP